MATNLKWTVLSNIPNIECNIYITVTDTNVILYNNYVAIKFSTEEGTCVLKACARLKLKNITLD